MLVSVWFLKKLERQNKKIEIDDPRPPKKNSFESLWGRRSSCKMCIQKKKTLENYVDEKQVGINKRSSKKYFIIKCISKAVSVWSV